ncbi:hypothetical protein P8452_02984 [Trifolium repens]|nr:hypothetical protein P8452_02984 [Trifolium repens]
MTKTSYHSISKIPPNSTMHKLKLVWISCWCRPSILVVEQLNWMLLLKSEQFYGCKLESMRNLIHATLLLVHESNWKSR